MNFPKAFMTKKELREIGVPEATLERIWNTKGQNIAFRACPGKKTSPIIFDTESLSKQLAKETRIEAATREI
nr:MAG TPA: hypothetical protein [Caudoviricetes sp.]